MKILAINNIYPPAQLGGYEQLCFDVVEGLKRYGHSVCVLTSDIGVDKDIREKGIKRILKLDTRFLGKRSVGPIRSVKSNNLVFSQVLVEFDPDVIFVWNLECIGRLLMRQIAGSGKKVLYHLSSPWILQDDTVASLVKMSKGFSILNAVKAVLRPVIRRADVLYDPKENVIENASFSCQSLQNTVLSAGIRVKNSFVVHEGIVIDGLPQRDWDVKPLGSRLRLLYAGQLERHKGVHTAILSVTKLVQMGNDVNLTVIGKGDPEYERYLRTLVESSGLSDRVSFLSPVSRDLLGSVVIDHDVLLFPSIWEEPWSLMLLIGMACGIAVVGTSTGGSREILVHGINSLVFSAGDEVELANRVRMLDEDRLLLMKLGRSASKLVRSQYGLEVMIDRMEKIVQKVKNS